MNEEMINIEVAYALPDRQKLLTLKVARGTSMYEAARQSGITGFFPELDLSGAPMGIFGKVEANPKARLLEDGDRVEIYRALTVDPKENRKARAKKAKEAKERRNE